MKLQKHLGFTLIEVIVVLAVVGVVLPTFFTLFYSILRQQVKVYRLTQVKRQGDFIMSTLENTIRSNAYRLYNGAVEVCAPTLPANGNVTAFQDSYRSSFSITTSGSNLQLSPQAVVPPAPTFAFVGGTLNDPSISILNFSMTCSRLSPFAAPIVYISFDATYNTASPNPQDNATLPYQTAVKLRNFPTE